MSVPLWLWLAVVAVILTMLAVDLVAHRGEQRRGSLREAAGWSAAWVTLGLGFGAVVWAMFGAQAAGEYYAGYLIEKSLAVDNVFVFALIFTAFAVPRAYQHRVLFYGVLGALVMRAVFIAGGVGTDRPLRLDAVRVRRVPGAHRRADVPSPQATSRPDPAPGAAPDPARRFPAPTTWHGAEVLGARSTARWVATPLFTVLILVEITDLIFAVDSIPAIFAVTREPFLVFTSNAFAILGLRAMYFLLADLMHRFVYLKVRPGGGAGLRRREDAPAGRLQDPDRRLAVRHRPPDQRVGRGQLAAHPPPAHPQHPRSRHARSPHTQVPLFPTVDHRPVLDHDLDHDRRALMTAISSADPTGSRTAAPLTSGLVTSLQALRGYPAVSLLMTTTPAPRMLPDDVARLAGLARQAQRRLEAEALPAVRRTVLSPLADLVAEAGRGPTTAAIGLFASAATSTAVRLPVPVSDRVVIDPTFATRDLVRALHRTPRHVVLALSLDEARLFDGMGEDLRPAPVRTFPRTAPGTAPAPGRGQVQQSESRRQRNVQPQQRRPFFRTSIVLSAPTSVASGTSCAGGHRARPGGVPPGVKPSVAAGRMRARRSADRSDL